MEANILCEREEQKVLSDLFEELSSLLQDSDDKEEKDRVHDRKKSEGWRRIVTGIIGIPLPRSR